MTITPRSLVLTLALAAALAGSARGARAATPPAGSLVRGSQAAVYFITADSKRYAFPNERVYRTWYADFASVTRVSDDVLAALPLGGMVRYRPGVRLVKIESDPKVYAVGSYGKLRWVTTEAIARTLYGAQWASTVDDLSAAFFTQYEIGDPITNAGDFTPSASRDAVPTIAVYLERMGVIAEGTNTTTAQQNPPTPAPSSQREGEGQTITIATSCAETLPQPSTEVYVAHVANIGGLRTAMTDARKRLPQATTIFLADGTYDLSGGQGFWIDVPGLTIRGTSGNRDAVTIRGSGMTGGTTHVFWIAADDVTLADMTIGWVKHHPIQVFGEQDVDRVRVRNLRIADGGQQLLKVSTDFKTAMSDDGIIECSLFEYTADIGPSWYIGGVDAHRSVDWIVRDNVFRNIRSPETADDGRGNWAEHAVHFWSDSKDTIVERNTIVNSDRGIGFGLGDRGHTGGIIRNNMIAHDASYGDVGIGLENAADARVLHNTIFFSNSYPNAIEYRFGGTRATITNNLTNKHIAARDGGTATLTTNVTNAVAAWFSDAASGNLRLARDVAGVTESGTALPDAPTDVDRAPRGAPPDIGADER